MSCWKWNFVFNNMSAGLVVSRRQPPSQQLPVSLCSSLGTGLWLHEIGCLWGDGTILQYAFLMVNQLGL